MLLSSHGYSTNSCRAEAASSALLPFFSVPGRSIFFLKRHVITTLWPHREAVEATFLISCVQVDGRVFLLLLVPAAFSNNTGKYRF